MENQRIDCLTEILEEIGLKATEEQVKRIAEDYALHLEMENEISSYGHIDASQTRNDCERLKRELSAEKVDSEKYREFIKKDKKASYVGIHNGVVEGVYA